MASTPDFRSLGRLPGEVVCVAGAAWVSGGLEWGVTGGPGVCRAGRKGPRRQNQPSAQSFQHFSKAAASPCHPPPALLLAAHFPLKWPGGPFAASWGYSRGFDSRGHGLHSAGESLLPPQRRGGLELTGPIPGRPAGRPCSLGNPTSSPESVPPSPCPRGCSPRPQDRSRVLPPPRDGRRPGSPYCPGSVSCPCILPANSPFA